MMPLYSLKLSCGPSLVLRKFKPISLKYLLVFSLTFFSFKSVRADYTVPSGQTINASAITGFSGVLYIYGTLAVNNANVFLSGFTSVVIYGPEGNIYWNFNKDLKFNAGTTFTIYNAGTTGGLQPTGGNAAKSLTIGSVTIAVSNDNSNNAAFSFAEFNAAGGLPQFTLNASGSFCTTNTFTTTLTPINSIIDYDCFWSINNAGTISPTSHLAFTTPQTATITPTATGSYTVTCVIKQAGDQDQITTLTRTVTVNSLPSVPTSATASPSSICSGASSNLNAISAGNTIEWYTVSSGGTSVGSSASAVNFSVSPANTTSYYAGSYNTTTGCRSSSRTSASVTVTPNVWQGINSNWDDVNNWCSLTVPTSSTNVQIDNGKNFYPIITANAFANNITIATGGTAVVTVNGGTLKIAGAVSSTNDIVATAGTIEMIGSAAQTIRADNFSSATIANLKITNTLAGASSASPSVAVNAAGGMLKVSGSVSFGSLNSAVLNTNDNLTLLSTASGTANIADLTNNDVNSGNTINGKVVVERYIPAHRAWRLLTAPVTSGSGVTLKSAWQDGAPAVTNINNINSTNNPNPGYGTHITYGMPSANGYDQGINGNPSIVYLTTGGWNGIPSSTTSVNVTSQPGFLLFVRGDRSTQLFLGTAAPETPTILRPSGNINQGLLNMPLGITYTSGTSNFRLINNPYPSAINYHKIATASVNSSASVPDAFYLWDPNITGSSGVGGWVGLSYNSSTLSYDRTVGASNISNNGDIQSGTAFLINYNGPASTLQIKESSKVNTSNNTQFRPMARVTASQLRISLLAQNADGTTSVNDGVLSTFNNSYNDAVDEQDLKKMNNFTENISVKNNGSLLSLERRNLIRNTDAVSYYLKGLKKKNYQLLIEPLNLVLPKGTNTVIKDNYLKTETIIDADAVYKYDFSVTADAASADSSRFSIAFSPSVIYGNIEAVKSNDDIDIRWTATEQKNIVKYIIEKSFDGSLFSYAGEKIRTEGEGVHSYTWKDAAPAPGKYFYRVKSVATLTGELYSNKVNAFIETGKDISVFPNPVKGNNVTVKLGKALKGVYTLRLMDNSGVVVYSKSFVRVNENNFTIVPNVLPATGTYRLEVVSPDKRTRNLQVFIVNK